MAVRVRLSLPRVRDRSSAPAVPEGQGEDMPGTEPRLERGGQSGCMAAGWQGEGAGLESRRPADTGSLEASARCRCSPRPLGLEGDVSVLE